MIQLECALENSMEDRLANVKLVNWKEVGTPLDENTQILKTEETECSQSLLFKKTRWRDV